MRVLICGLLLIVSIAQAQNNPNSLANSSSTKTVVAFPETKEGEISIQTSSNNFEVLPFVVVQGHALSASCDLEIKKSCRALGLRDVLEGSQQEIAEKCSSLKGESRIAKRYGVKKISSVCFFKEDKSFVEIY